MLLDRLLEFLSVCVQTTVDFNKYKCLRTSHIMHQPPVNSYFGLTTVKMPVAPLNHWLRDLFCHHDTLQPRCTQLGDCMAGTYGGAGGTNAPPLFLDKQV